MEEEKITKSIRKQATKRWKDTFSRKMSILCCLVLIFIATLIVGYFFPYTLFVSVPLIQIPAIFAFICVNTVFDFKDDQSDVKSYFIMFRSYFSRNFNGCFRVITGFLKGLLCVFIVMSVINTIGFEYVLSTDATLNATIEELLTADNYVELYNQILELIGNNNVFQNFINISLMAGLGVGFCMFFHHIMTHSVKYYFNLLGRAPLLSSDVNLVHAHAFKNIRKEFYKDYYRSIWFFPMLMVLGYCGGTVFGVLFIPNANVIQNCVIGFFGAFLFVLPAIPYYFDVLLLIFKKYQKAYLDSFIELSMKTLDELKKTEEITPDIQQKIDEMINDEKDNFSDEIVYDDEKEEENEKDREE